MHELVRDLSRPAEPDGNIARELAGDGGRVIPSLRWMKGPGMSDKSLAGLRIVIVEDEVLIADEMAEALAQLGAGMMGPAATLSQAEAPVGSGERIDVAVLDFNLRGLMVYDLADRRIARGVAVVFATGDGRFVMSERSAGIPYCESRKWATA